MDDEGLVSILSGRKFPGKGSRKAKAPAREKPRPPAVFDETAATVLRQTKLTKKQFGKYMEHLTYYILTHTSAEYARSLFEGISEGNGRDMMAFEKIFGMVKGGDGLVINLNQNNLSVSQGSSNRDFDSLLREIDRAEAETGAIEASVVPVAAITEGD